MKLRFEPANAKTLQLDIDSGSELTAFWTRLKWFSCMADAESGFHLGLRAVSVSRSRHGNWHVEIKLGTRLRLIERIALQAILGSDRDRELCNYERMKFRSTYPILFIKDAKDGIIRWTTRREKTRSKAGTKQTAGARRTIRLATVRQRNAELQPLNGKLAAQDRPAARHGRVC